MKKGIRTNKKCFFFFLITLNFAFKITKNIITQKVRLGFKPKKYLTIFGIN